MLTNSLSRTEYTKPRFRNPSNRHHPYALFSDLALVLIARQGVAGAYEQLALRTASKAWSVARAILGDTPLTQSAVQASFAIASDRLCLLHNVNQFSTWLGVISRKQALQLLNYRMRCQPPSPTQQHDPKNPLGSLQTGSDPHSFKRPERPLPNWGSEPQELLLATMAALGAETASLLDLFHRHSVPANQLAEELDLSSAETTNLLHFATEQMRQTLRSYFVWRDSQHKCPEQEGKPDLNKFDQHTDRTIRRHLATCASCRRRVDAKADPLVLFKRVPMFAVHDLERQRLRASLERKRPTHTEDSQKLRYCRA